jgi:sortase B
LQTKEGRKRGKMIRKIIALLVLLMAIGVMIHAGKQLFETELSYQEGNTAYEDIRDMVRVSRPANPQPELEDNLYTTQKNIDIDIEIKDEEPSEITVTEHIYIPESEINFETLKSFSNNAAAWLYSPNTLIDYPVMKADDYSYYLTHLPDGRKNGGGSLFIDYNCASDFSGKLTVIYGHHMKNGTMFGSLLKYKEKGYYEKHPFMYLYTEQTNYRIDILYGCVIDAGQWREQAYIYEENLESLLTYAADNTTFKNNLLYTEEDKVIVLSTCSYEFDNARYIVIGILREAH